MSKSRNRNKTVPLRENEQVKELLAVMEENNLSNMKDLISVLDQVGALEKQLNEAVNELAVMRQELDAAREAAHPIANTLQKSVIILQNHVLHLRDNLADIKQKVIEGCKNAVGAFKENGIAALDNMARFFHIRPGLESMRNHLEHGIKQDEKTLAAIEAVNAEYHEAGRHLKNMGRVLTGKEEIADPKPAGKLTKTLEAPFRAQRSLFTSMRSGVENALNNLDRLEQAHKPSIRQSMSEYNKQIADVPKTAPEKAATHDSR